MNIVRWIGRGLLHIDIIIVLLYGQREKNVDRCENKCWKLILSTDTHLSAACVELFDKTRISGLAKKTWQSKSDGRETVCHLQELEVIGVTVF